jgi:molybdopterin-biosynthesis enzyme MoeA-like protein
MQQGNKTAAVMVIGDEILSGRTQDSNSHYIARFLATLGIDLKEIRVVPDVEDEIVAGLNALRTRYDLVFTTGGIGPTYALLEARYAPGEFNEMRKRMARIPHGGSLVKNTASVAPGFHIGNVYVMAGVPAVMRSMMEAIAGDLPQGVPVTAITISIDTGEGWVAAGLAAIQKVHADVSIGSYPFTREDGGFGTQLVTRGRDPGAVATAAQAIEALLRELNITGTRL